MISRDALYDLYWNQDLSIREVGDRLSFSPTNVHYWLKKHHIRRRGVVESHDHQRRFSLTKEDLQQFYWKEELSLSEIAEISGVTHAVVLKYMKKFHIPRRKTLTSRAIQKMREAHKKALQNADYRRKLRNYWNRNILAVEKKLERSLRNILYDFYWTQRKTLKEIGEILGVSDNTVQRWMRGLSIKRRTIDITQPEVLKKILKATNARPNKKEQKLIDLFSQQNLPFKYVGDGSLIIDRKCPDFTDGNGKLIEFFGVHWHNLEEEQERINFFKERGYNCLVIWEDELKNEDALLEKVTNFSRR